MIEEITGVLRLNDGEKNFFYEITNVEEVNGEYFVTVDCGKEFVVLRKNCVFELRNGVMVETDYNVNKFEFTREVRVI